MDLIIRPLQSAADAAAFRALNELRGCGAGRALLTAAIHHARRVGAQSIFLGSSTKLVNA